MPDAQVIGVDLGGTAIKLARIRADGTVLAEAQVPTPQPAMPGVVTMALCEPLNRLTRSMRLRRSVSDSLVRWM